MQTYTTLNFHLAKQKTKDTGNESKFWKLCKRWLLKESLTEQSARNQRLGNTEHDLIFKAAATPAKKV